MDDTCQVIITLEPGATAAARLNAVLGTGPIATVIVSQPATGGLDAGLARELVEIIQKADIAALIEGDPALARALRADGVYLPPGPAILERAGEAREILGTRYIVGAGAGKSRHDAMSLGEAGVEFVGFGVPDGVQDIDGARARRFDQISWWAEIFEVPCVAFDVTRAEDADVLSAAGADFVAVPIPHALSPADIAEHLIEIRAAIAAGIGQRRVEA